MIIDSSSLISLAWSGQLGLLERSPLPVRIPEEVRREVVTEGRSGGHADAWAIESALGTIDSIDVQADLRGDAAVLAAAHSDGTLMCNDQALGRRARSLGLGWMRTVDFIVLCARAGRCSDEDGRHAIQALFDTGRISPELRDAYLEELT